MEVRIKMDVHTQLFMRWNVSFRNKELKRKFFMSAVRACSPVSTVRAAGEKAAASLMMPLILQLKKSSPQMELLSVRPSISEVLPED